MKEQTIFATNKTSGKGTFEFDTINPSAEATITNVFEKLPNVKDSINVIISSGPVLKFKSQVIDVGINQFKIEMKNNELTTRCSWGLTLSSV